MFLAEEYTFDDILLIPQRSIIFSTSSEVSTHTIVGNIFLELPVISAAMTTVTGVRMQQAMIDGGGIGIHHRYTDETNGTFTKKQKLSMFVERVRHGPVAVSPSMGKEFIADLVGELNNRSIDRHRQIFVIDVAHGHRQEVLDFAHYLKTLNVTVWSGNIVTAEAALEYATILDPQIDAIKVGVGPGTACSTRIVAGAGRPQASALWDICTSLAERRINLSVISDGGIKSSGDIVKALALGADAVIVGGLLAGTTESEGPVLSNLETNKLYKKFEGMASESALEKAGKKVRVEGVSGTVPLKGSVADVLSQFKDGIQTGMSYVGARNIYELRERAAFVRQTHAGYIEGTPRI